MRTKTQLFLLTILLYNVLPMNAQGNSDGKLQFTKAVESLSNYYSEILSYYQNAPVMTAQINIQNLKQSASAPIYLINYKSAEEEADRSAIDNYLSAKNDKETFFEKKELIELVSLAESRSDEVKKNCMALSNYFSNKVYQQDKNFGIYPMLVDSLESSIDRARTSWKRVNTLNTDIKESAELDVLKANPNAIFLVPMKQDLTSLGKIVEQIYSQDISVTLLRMDVNSLKDELNRHKNITGKDKSISRDAAYADYYNLNYQCITTIESILNNIEQNRIDDSLDSLFDQLNDQYSDVNETYKKFSAQ